MSESLSDVQRKDIFDIVMKGVRDTIEIADEPVISVEEVSEETRLVGRSAVVDSMGLVSLLLDIEQEVNDRYETYIVIADERAMSQKQSPFRSVGTLADYVYQLVSEQKTGG